MESINSWINKEEVRKLAEELIAKPVEYKPSEITKKFEWTSEISQALKDSKSSSLADASAMAASAGLIGNNSNLATKENAVDEGISETLVHPEKEISNFAEIDKQLLDTVQAKGICVIDRDGDVLYTSLQNHNLVAFIVHAMLGTKLMETVKGEFGNIRVKISAGEYLEFVSVRSMSGVLVLAVHLDHILGKTNAQFVAGDLLKIADLV